MRFRRLLGRVGLLGLALVLVVAGPVFMLRPSVTPRTEIFNGVFLTVEDVPGGQGGSGRVMIVEVKWDTPGVRIANRPFSYALKPDDPNAPQYRLALADWSLFRDGASILVNTTEYAPDSKFRSFPGMPVRSVETVVAEGQVSHVDANSYLMYWDKDGHARLLFTKPPDAASLADAKVGFGVEGVPIYDGQARYNAFSNKTDLISRTFIGFNENTRTLYLLAFERASAYEMVQRALEAGVRFGAQVDSGSSTTLLVGAGAKGMLPHTGVRNWRPLGAYLEVYADQVTF